MYTLLCKCLVGILITATVCCRRRLFFHSESLLSPILPTSSPTNSVSLMTWNSGLVAAVSCNSFLAYLQYSSLPLPVQSFALYLTHSLGYTSDKHFLNVHITQPIMNAFTWLYFADNIIYRENTLSSRGKLVSMKL